jgi:branched-chain amino acid transport system permease protein
VETLFPQFVAGISRGMLYFLVASGLTLVFGVLRVINFAHGTMYMLGAFFCYSLTKFLFGLGEANFWVSLVIAPLLVSLIAYLIERFALRRIYAREHLYQLLLTWAFVYIIGDLSKITWGTLPVSVKKPHLVTGAINLLGATIPRHYIFIIVLSVFVGVCLWLFLYRTKYGNLIVAAAEDPEMTRALGINCDRIYLAVFVMGCAISALGGAGAVTMMAPVVGMDMDIVLPAFVIVVVGGLGSVLGALVGSLLIGLVESFGTLLIPRLSVVLIFAVMAFVLIIRPWGIFGIQEER